MPPKATTSGATSQSFPETSSAAMMPTLANLKISSRMQHTGKLCLATIPLSPIGTSRRAKRHGKSAVVQLSLSHGLAVGASWQARPRRRQTVLRITSASACSEASLRPSGRVPKISRLLQRKLGGNLRSFRTFQTEGPHAPCGGRSQARAPWSHPADNREMTGQKGGSPQTSGACFQTFVSM